MRVHVIRVLLGFAVLTGFFLLGIFLHGLGLPIPGGVLRHMVLLFIPLTVGLMELGPLLSRQALAITASLLVSLTAVLLTTGLLGQWLLPSALQETPVNPSAEASE